jgi:glycogen debranching enzyme
VLPGGATEGERIPRDTLLIRRFIGLEGDQLHEVISVRSFSETPLLLDFETWVGARFEDIFEVRGYHRRSRGKLLPCLEEQGSHGPRTGFRYAGLDGRERTAWVERFYPCEKVRVLPQLEGQSFRTSLPPRGELVLRTLVSFQGRPHPRLLRRNGGTATEGRSFADLSLAEVALAFHDASPGHPLPGPTRIETDNAILNRALDAAAIDLGMLLTEEGPGRIYPYAGIPWFSAPFGRDGLVTALQLLPWHPEIARGVLDFAFEHLGEKHEPFTAEEPGKVFHELRRSELCRTGELPFSPYYGSVDGTPLALCLFTEYFSWTRDRESALRWWPSILRCLSWMRKNPGVTRNGFLEYAGLSEKGLRNQGWKDSHDSVMHADGTLAEGPIQLCEVQAYAFRALQTLAPIAQLLGQDALALELSSWALDLRSRFLASYWDEKRHLIALALDGQGKPCAVRTSNMGHCLWGKILPPELASVVCDDLMSESLFNGYGIRTLASDERNYNPMSYHNGSVWPHDNSLILEGFRSYSALQPVERLGAAMLELLETLPDLRLPELFCGFRKREREPPVPYEVACRPQAWAAGTAFSLIRSLLGLSISPEADSPLLLRSPILTSRIRELSIERLRYGQEELDLHFTRTSNSVQVRSRKRTLGARFLQMR